MISETWRINDQVIVMWPKGSAPTPPEPEALRPSDYMDAKTALVVAVVSLIVLNPPKLSGALLASLAGYGIAWQAAAAAGYEADAVVVFAAFFAMRAVYRAYQIGLTLLATFPLTLTFSFVVDIIPRFSINERDFFAADGATPEVAARRKAALEALKKKWELKYPQCLQFGHSLKTLISDVRFTSGRCFPPFSEVTNKYLDPSMALAKTEGPCVVDIDGNRSLDISGSYGVNVCGYESYKQFITAGWQCAKEKAIRLTHTHFPHMPQPILPVYQRRWCVCYILFSPPPISPTCHSSFFLYITGLLLLLFLVSI